MKWLYIALAVLLVLVVYLCPRIVNAWRGSQISALVGNGRLIYLCIFARKGSLFELAEDPIMFPMSSGDHAFDTSTEYFEHHVREGERGLEYRHFAGLDAKPSQDGEFRAENNGWCVVADLTRESSVNTPLLISRNFNLNSLADSPKVVDSRMIGDKYGVVIALGGYAMTLNMDELDGLLRALNLTNKVLRP